jgi:hypothetical protein
VPGPVPQVWVEKACMNVMALSGTMDNVEDVV